MNQLIKIFCEIDDYCKEYELILYTIQYGFGKCDGNGEILSFCITSGNVSDIDEKVIEKLFQKHITMITKICSNMKNKLVTLEDKLFLRK